MIEVLIVAFAFSLGWFVSGNYIGSIMRKNRAIEQEPNKREEAPTEREMKWHLVHIRDDTGSLCGLLCITNGLLAALVALLLMK